VRIRIAFVAILLLAPFQVRAAESDQRAQATALFEEGLKLMDKGNYGEACPKLAQSQELAPSGGTLLNLASCYEKNRQHASAWLRYKEAAERASSAKKRDMEKLALERAKKIEARLAKLTIVVHEPVAGLQVRRNGRPVADAELGVATPIDPGNYHIEASAPGRKSFSTDVEVADKAQNQSVEIPSLAPTASATPLAAPMSAGTDARQEHPAGPPPHSRGTTQRALGVGIGVVGIVGLGVGTYFGLRAKSKNDDASAHCVGDTRCDSTGIELDDQARTSATVSTIAFAAGGGLLALGTIVYLAAPSGNSATAGLRVQRTDHGAAVRVNVGTSF
jgi:hypothetical protein